MAQPPSRSSANDYGYSIPITTRWMDNDAYGHVNNVVYYSYFDTVANHFLIQQGGLDIETSPVIGLVVASNCDYFEPLAYPESLFGALRVDRLGRSSVTYGIAIFREGSELASAQGRFTHVFVDRKTRKSAEIPDSIRAALSRIQGNS